MKIKFRQIALMALAMLPLSAYCTPVTVGDREWQQPDLLTGFSWNQIAEVCPTDGSACSGYLNAVDVSGWKWASVRTVASLFAEMDGHPGNRGSHSEIDSGWAPDFLALFTPTFRAPGAGIVHGWTSSSDRFYGYYTAYVFDHYFDGATDVTQVRRLPNASVSSDAIGAWLYRDVAATTVPEPAPISLMGLGLVGFLLARKRSSRLVGAASVGAASRRDSC